MTFETIDQDAKKLVRITVNGEPSDVFAAANETLLGALRNRLDLTGTKYGCGTGDCCACTVMLDDEAVLSCLCLVSELDGCSVTTIEGLSDGTKINPVQAKFAELGAVQCGFCTPGMIMTINALIKENPTPTEAEVRHFLRGNLCRCTGYVKIVAATLSAARSMNGDVEKC